MPYHVNVIYCKMLPRQDQIVGQHTRDEARGYKALDALGVLVPSAGLPRLEAPAAGQDVHATFLLPPPDLCEDMCHVASVAAEWMLLQLGARCVYCSAFWLQRRLP